MQRLTSPKGSNTLQLDLAPAPSAFSHAAVMLSTALPNTSWLRMSCSFSLKLGMASAHVGCDLHLSSLWLLHNKHAAHPHHRPFAIVVQWCAAIHVVAVLASAAGMPWLGTAHECTEMQCSSAITLPCCSKQRRAVQ